MNQRREPNLHPLLPATEIAAMPEITRVHPLNARAVRYSRSLGDATGLGRLGVHLVRLRRGDSSTELHVHASAEEFVYVLSGRGVARIGEESVAVGAGDFMGFAAGGLAHALHNPHDEDLVYLMGGERVGEDQVLYPQVRKRLLVGDGEERMLDVAEDTADGSPPAR